MTDRTDDPQPVGGSAGAVVEADDDLFEVPPDVAARLVRALDRAPGAFATLIDADMRNRWLSRSATWVTGTDPVSRPGRDALERVHPDDVQRLNHAIAQLHAVQGDGETVPVIEPLRYRLRRPDDTWMTVESIVHNLLDDPVVQGLLVIGRPVGGELDGVGHVVDLLTADAPLPEVLAACAGLVPDYVGSAAVVGLLDGHAVVGARPGGPAERLSTDDRWWRGVMADRRPLTPCGFDDFPGDLAALARELGFRSAWVLPLTEASTGDMLGCVVVWARLAVELNIGTEDGLRQAIRLATLVMGEQRRQHALQRAAVTDPLTGVGNRSALRRRLDTAPGPVTVALVDLDDFKPVNDTHGHDVGDAVLRVVAARIAGAVREDDLVVRFGGDEFAVVFADGRMVEGQPVGPAASAVGDGAEGPVDRIVEAIEAPIALDVGGRVEAGADPNGDADRNSSADPNGDADPKGHADPNGRADPNGHAESGADPSVDHVGRSGTGRTITVGASAGLATALPGEVVHLADAALYEAKRRKRLATG